MDLPKLNKLLEELTTVLGEYAGWSGFYGALPGAGPGGGAPVGRDLSGQAWPWRTTSAHHVWAIAKKLIPMYPEVSEPEILRMAVQKSGIPPRQLTPEDWRLLEMAIEWRRNGTTYVKSPRIGGAPGGPASSYRDGHFLKGRGAP